MNENENQMQRPEIGATRIAEYRQEYVVIQEWLHAPITVEKPGRWTPPSPLFVKEGDWRSRRGRSIVMSAPPWEALHERQGREQQRKVDTDGIFHNQRPVQP